MVAPSVIPDQLAYFKYNTLYIIIFLGSANDFKKVCFMYDNRYHIGVSWLLSRSS